MAGKLPNVFLITVDCLRSDHLGCYGYVRNTSPNIDRIASQGVLFKQAISNGGNTPSAFPSILASALPPLSVSEHKTIMKQHTTLAEIFKKAGYSTAAFTSNPYLSQLTGYNKGFDIFDEGRGGYASAFGRLRQWLSERILKAISSQQILDFLIKISIRIDTLSLITFKHSPTTKAEQISSQAVSWLNSHENNFFLWLHYMDVHAPYLPPQKYVREFHKQPLSRRKMIAASEKSDKDMERISSSELQIMGDLYDASIKYVDDSINWLLTTAGKRLDNTIIVITADHGEDFGEHGKSKAGHLTLYESVVHVPLIIAGTRIDSAPSIEAQVGLIDLAPTLIDLAGLPKPTTFNGQTLLPLMKGESKTNEGVLSVYAPPGFLMCGAAVTEITFSYRKPKWKYIRTESIVFPNSVLAEELYNLRDDPGEKVNLIGLETDEVHKFKLEAINALEQLKKSKMEQSTSFEKLRVKDKIKKLPKL